ncbi:hypothetical protein SK355_02230 [Candidatus Fukatsuia symbiotica]|uniref:Uncharacterized protein n=2 Tax=Candidatus Fukatsuia symbiotica TaxID=1878942 RepID=A0A2Y9CKB4_9GAMM|nr:hypothetical protein [Candidatus Fukatsuia symbiotica]AWK13282.1 hypothetical protein CCS41_00310 [Candidatus Fukatsuia symbiotica]MEA9444155.1 hypothetical protein [Candidatus Fukatsuia symbiotica]
MNVPLIFGVAYGVLLHHLPSRAQQTQHWQYKCLDLGGIQLIAKGTIHNRFDNLQVPNSKQKVVSVQNVYPGTPITLPNIKRLTGQVEREAFAISCS